MKRKINSPEGFDLWLGKPAPRYTSYPPAPFFNGSMTAREYVKSLKNIAYEPQVVSLYIHIPFCRSLCLYCGCNATATHRGERIEAYIGALVREIGIVTAATGKLSVRSLHFGGGTPNILSRQELCALFAALNAAFDLSAVQEIAMELDPREVSADQVEALAECGVTRVSLGVQDFNPEVQKAVQREQPFDQVAAVCALLHEHGIANINLDLMYGLPLQTRQTMEEAAKRACTLAPQRIVLFSYAHVPHIKKHQKALERYGLPDMQEKLALEEAARAVVEAQGYVPIGIDHFARGEDPLARALHEGRLRRNFQGYTDEESQVLLGFGCSAIGQTNDGYFQNEHNEEAYQALIAQGALPVKRGYLLSEEDRLRGAIIERLMCDLWCDIGALCEKHGVPIEALAGAFARLEPFEKAGLIERKDHVIKLATPYRMAIRVIALAFDAHTTHAASRTV